MPTRPIIPDTPPQLHVLTDSSLLDNSFIQSEQRHNVRSIRGLESLWTPCMALYSTQLEAVVIVMAAVEETPRL